MRVFRLWILALAAGTVFTVLTFGGSCYYRPGSTTDVYFHLNVDLVTGQLGENVSMMSTNRKLKEKIYKPNDGIKIKTRDLRSLHLEDYHPIDPVPSSKASVQPGPTPHRTPLIPYIPQPTPPSPPNPRHAGGFP